MTNGIAECVFGALGLVLIYMFECKKFEKDDCACLNLEECMEDYTDFYTSSCCMPVDAGSGSNGNAPPIDGSTSSEEGDVDCSSSPPLRLPEYASGVFT